MQKGFLLVEVLIALTILIVISSIAVTTLVAGYQAINFNADSLEANLLAKEGANSLRGLRDTNWLRFSYDKENCWDSLDESCTVHFNLGTYKLETSLYDPPELVPVSSDLDLSNPDNGMENYRLFYQDPLPTDNIPERIVVHYSNPLAEPLPSGYERSKFYRMVEITNIDSEIMEGYVKVQWKEGSDVETIQIPVILRNYQSPV